MPIRSYADNLKYIAANLQNYQKEHQISDGLAERLFNAAVEGGAQVAQHIEDVLERRGAQGISLELQPQLAAAPDLSARRGKTEPTHYMNVHLYGPYSPDTIPEFFRPSNGPLFWTETLGENFGVMGAPQPGVDFGTRMPSGDFRTKSQGSGEVRSSTLPDLWTPFETHIHQAHASVSAEVKGQNPGGAMAYMTLTLDEVQSGEPLELRFAVPIAADGTFKAEVRTPNGGGLAVQGAVDKQPQTLSFDFTYQPREGVAAKGHVDSHRVLES